MFEGFLAVLRQVTDVTLRQLPGGLALGLVAALFAHAAVFGGDHAMGGAYSGPLLELALASLAGLAAIAALTFRYQAGAADGSVLAARTAPLIPGASCVAASAAGWFALGEAIEPAHAAVSLVLLGAAIVCCSGIVVRLASAALRLLASFVFEVMRELDVLRRPELVEGQLEFRAAPRPAANETVWLKRFLRPPPVLANG